MNRRCVNIVKTCVSYTQIKPTGAYGFGVIQPSEAFTSFKT